MKKVIIPTELVNVMAEDEIIKTHIKKAEREIKKQRINELIAEGIDKVTAKAMVEAFMACGL